jgi:MATE family multidrug resistance protein
MALLSTARLNDWKTLLKFSWPLIVANAFWNIQITIDRIILGQFSAEALAATVGTMGIFWAPMALIQQTAAYVTTFTAQYSGAKQPHNIGPALWQSFYISIFGGILFLLLIPAAPALFKLFGHPAALQLLEIDYFRAICFSALPTALMAAISGFFTGTERPSVTLHMNAIAMVIHAILAYILVFGHFGLPRMGVIGAGVATSIAAFIGCGYGLYLLCAPNLQKKYALLSGYKWNTALMKQYLKFGLPSGLQWALEGLAFTVFLVFIGRMPNGEIALASSGIAVTVMMLAILPILGVAQGIATLVGKHLGEDNPDKAEQVTWTGIQVSLLYISVMATTFFCFPNFYLSWFSNPQNTAIFSQIAAIVPTLLIFVSIFIFFDCINVIFSFALRGAGDTKFVSLIALVLPWPLMVIPTYFVISHIKGVILAWGFVSIYIVIQSLIFLKRFKEGKWRKMRVIPVINS